MPVDVFVETPLQDDVREMILALNAHLRPLSPAEFQFQLTAEQLAGDDTTVFVARDAAGRAVGMGALRRHGGAIGEVKRMYALPALRGQGVGWRLLAHIIAAARAEGLPRLVLETGVEAAMPEAWRLYARAGFTRCGPVLDYPDSDHNAFFELWLHAPSARG